MKVMKYNDVNLYLKFSATPEKDKKRDLIIRMTIPAVLLVIIMFSISAVLFAKVAYLSAESMGYEAELGDPTILEDYNKASELDNDTQLQYYYIEGIKTFDSMLATYPDVTSDLINNIYDCNKSGIAISDINFDGNTGEITFKASSNGVDEVPNYVENLRQSGKYFKVEYTGYTLEEEEIEGMIVSFKYNFTVRCVLLPAETPAPEEIPDETAEETTAEETAAV